MFRVVWEDEQTNAASIDASLTSSPLKNDFLEINILAILIFGI